VVLVLCPLPGAPVLAEALREAASFALLFENSQAFLPSQSMNPLFVYRPTFPLQKRPYPTVAIARVVFGEGDHPL
jgi:hypothetical protein